MEFKELFNVEKPILAMLHLKGEDKEDVLKKAINEIAIYESVGVDAIIVENYFGTYENVVDVLEYLKDKELSAKIGINLLNNDAMGFELVKKYGLDFIQIDSVVGHVKPRDEVTLDHFLRMWREKTNTCLLGGVRFKYQPVLSENTLQQDLIIAKERCDSICVTGSGTGVETSIDKINEFRRFVGDFPLIVAAGVTVDNIIEQLDICDAAIIGSAFKDTGKDSGEVEKKKVEEIMKIVKEMRERHD